MSSQRATNGAGNRPAGSVLADLGGPEGIQACVAWAVAEGLVSVKPAPSLTPRQMEQRAGRAARNELRALEPQVRELLKLHTQLEIARRLNISPGSIALVVKRIKQRPAGQGLDVNLESRKAG